MSIPENIALVRERIASAARRAGRNPQEIALLAVTKTFAPESIREAYQAGLRLFGENRVQEFARKAESLRDLPNAEWHMIGHLQSNKAAQAVELFAAVDSVDSLRLAQKLDSATKPRGKKLPILIEVNVGSEVAKSGVLPESPALEDLLMAAAALEHLEIRGLMTIPPFADDPGEARPYFRKLRELRKQISDRKIPGVRMDILSMGMSHDFEIAIEEGSTCVRVGTAILGERTIS
ncbi:MAG TPA: YggS family pyridoxal phosphate-dependent enzyme [Terriglobales bacterium]|jgi:pyridoxal phosphate enzyme (YggS family)|nr:YggS family pyridoxal phosphate-dependent enzyme [Terriglobales bacterium]